MQNSRLIQLLEIFNKRELKELNQFIECVFFHSNSKRYKKVIQLFQKVISGVFIVRYLYVYMRCVCVCACK